MQYIKLEIEYHDGVNTINRPRLLHRKHLLNAQIDARELMVNDIDHEIQEIHLVMFGDELKYTFRRDADTQNITMIDYTPPSAITPSATTKLPPDRVFSKPPK